MLKGFLRDIVLWLSGLIIIFKKKQSSQKLSEGTKLFTI